MYEFAFCPDLFTSHHGLFGRTSNYYVTMKLHSDNDNLWKPPCIVNEGPCLNADGQSCGAGLKEITTSCVCSATTGRILTSLAKTNNLSDIYPINIICFETILMHSQLVINFERNTFKYQKLIKFRLFMENLRDMKFISELYTFKLQKRIQQMDFLISLY